MTPRPIHAVKKKEEEKVAWPSLSSIRNTDPLRFTYVCLLLVGVVV